MCGELALLIVSMRKTTSSIFYHRLHIHKRERKLQIFKKGTGCDESQLQYHKNLVLSLVLNPFLSLCYIWWFYVPHTKNALSSIERKGKERKKLIKRERKKVLNGKKCKLKRLFEASFLLSLFSSLMASNFEHIWVLSMEMKRR